jgi:hypothetical protein
VDLTLDKETLEVLRYHLVMLQVAQQVAVAVAGAVLAQQVTVLIQVEAELVDLVKLGKVL